MQTWLPALVVSLSLAALLVCGFLLTWWIARARVRALFAGPPRRRWAEAPGAPGDGAPGLERSWGALGYDALGELIWDEARGTRAQVLAHRSLPIYALQLSHSRDSAALAVFLVTFYDGGGKITTTSSLGAVAPLPGLDAGAPHLVQVREGGAPAALDGQHTGSVQAWAVGGRRPLPATRDALPGYLAADHERLRRALEEDGWLSLGSYVRALQHPGVLRF